MLHYEYFAFAAPPRTATTWFMYAAAKAGFSQPKGTLLFDKHRPFDRPGLYRISTVRCPPEWLESIFLTSACYSPLRKEDTHRVREIRLLAKKHRLSFTNFLTAYLEDPHMFVGRVFRDYAADTCMRVEDLPWAAKEIFAQFGSNVELPQPINVRHGKTEALSQIPREMRRDIIRKEREFCELYEYY